MQKGAIGTLQLLVIVTVLGVALTAFIVHTVHSIETKSEITANVENGLVPKPLN